MTVKDLYQICKEVVEEGNADCPVFVCTRNYDGAEYCSELETGFSSVVNNSAYVENVVTDSGYEPEDVFVLN